MTRPEEIKSAKAEAEAQLARARERTEVAHEVKDWWVKQRRRNNFRAVIENLVRGT